MTSFFKSILSDLEISKAADKLFRIPHDNYEQRIMAAEELISQLPSNSDEKQYFEDMLKIIFDEQDEASSRPNSNPSARSA
jgi:hypothetical protein